jgi:putative transposase
MIEFYRSLKGIDLHSSYKKACITRACTILKSRKKGKMRGFKIRGLRPLKPMICITSGFFVTMKGRLFVPLQRGSYFDLQLNHHVQERLTGRKVRSLTISRNVLSFCYSDEVKPVPVKSVLGLDRNEKNLTFGNVEGVIQIDLSKTVRIRSTTREVLGSFKRSDVRMRRKLARKYWTRSNNRTDRLLHAATNLVVGCASASCASLAIEDLTNINRLYQKGNGQNRDFRFRLNSWPHHKSKRMLAYKAAWKGVALIQLTKSETNGSSSVHSACGEKLRSPAMGDAVHGRELWCQSCKVWIDRDVNAAIVLSQRGLARFASSLPKPKSCSHEPLEAEEKGLASEAVMRNGTKTPILRVDASKLAHGPIDGRPFNRWKS